jgi:hypothetical protein
MLFLPITELSKTDFLRKNIVNLNSRALAIEYRFRNYEKFQNYYCRVSSGFNKISASCGLKWRINWLKVQKSSIA